MPDQNAPIVHEILDRKLLFMLLGAFVFIATGGSYLLFLSPRMADNPYLPVLRMAFPVCAAMLLVAIIRLLCCRVHIDETGVTTDRLPFGQTSLRWEEISTAAIVHLSMGSNSETIIVLATLPPGEVLSRGALLGLHGPGADEHIRLSHSPTRVAAVQHYLHMPLPEYRL